ncbi:MAG: LamG-like jellyroll fold domain-containing protein [Cyanobacteria bacterium P01_A01_bin.80]
MFGVKKGSIFKGEHVAYFNNSYIDLPSGLRLDNKSFTVECFAKRTESLRRDYAILGINTSGSQVTNNKIHLLQRQSKEDWYLLFGTWANDFAGSSTPILDNIWYKMGFVTNVSTNERKIYLDSQVLNTVDKGAYEGSNPLTIGSWNNNPATTGFAGEMSFLRIWDKALTLGEFTNLGTSKINAPQSNLYANYNFNNNSLDTSGNNYHGIPNNVTYGRIF